MKCSLFGGSNSVLTNGLQKALRENFDVSNYALGATSSIQNTCELVRNYQVVQYSDFIITESNVNDIMSYKFLDLSVEQVVEQINEYYRLLNNLNLPIFVLILPTHRKQEKIEDIKFINNLHLENCYKYNFFYVNLDSLIDSIPSDFLNLLMPHPRHFNEAYVYQMVLKLSLYIKSFLKSYRYESKVHYQGPEYLFLSADKLEPQGKIEHKKNSAYSIDYLEIEALEYTFPSAYFGWDLIAINAWCDGYSKIEISSQQYSDKITKSFNQLYTCTEFVKKIAIKNDTVIKLNKENQPADEPTLLVRFEKDAPINNMKLEGFLLVNDLQDPEYPNVLDWFNTPTMDLTQQMIGSWEPYVASAKTLLQLVKQ